MDEMSNCGSVFSLFFWEYKSHNYSVFIENICIAYIFTLWLDNFT